MGMPSVSGALKRNRWLERKQKGTGWSRRKAMRNSLQGTAGRAEEERRTNTKAGVVKTRWERRWWLEKKPWGEEKITCSSIQERDTRRPHLST